MKVLMIIPAYNEEKNLKRVVDHLRRVCPQFDYVIVNDGSTDGSGAIAAEYAARYPGLLRLIEQAGMELDRTKINAFFIFSN